MNMRGLALSLTVAPPAAHAEAASVPMDEENLREFYEETARPLLAYLTRASGSAETAGDLFQETYFHWLRARNVPSGDGVIRRKYLFRIATNLLRDHWRRSKREAGANREAAAEPAVECDRELSCNVRSAFDKLNPREREMLWLAYVEEYDQREIAAITGVRFGSVRMLLFRARHKLAELVRAGQVWWKAQIRARREDAERALKPVRLVQRASAVCALLGLLFLILHYAPQLQAWLYHPPAVVPNAEESLAAVIFASAVVCVLSVSAGLTYLLHSSK